MGVDSDVGGVTGHNGDEKENGDFRFYQLITSRMVFLVALVKTRKMMSSTPLLTCSYTCFSNPHVAQLLPLSAQQVIHLPCR